MPHRVFIEHCACPGGQGPDRMEGGRPEPRTQRILCDSCGQLIRVQRWMISVVEGWGLSHRVAGFVSVAPGGWPADHPGAAYVRAAQEMLCALSERCEACFGFGVSGDWDGWVRECPYCRGLGRVPSAPVEVLQDAHRRWFHRWPQYYRQSLLFGIAEAGEVDAPPRYGGPALEYRADKETLIVFGPVPFQRTRGGEQGWRFIPEPVARAHAKLLQIVHGATTWGAARRSLNADPLLTRLFDEVTEWQRDESGALPTDDAPFDTADVLPEGPPQPHEVASDWFPRPIGGEPVVDVNEWSECRASDVPKVVAYLERCGFRVVRDDLLVIAAYTPERITDARQVAPRTGPHMEWPGWTVFHVPHASRHIPPQARRSIMLDKDALRLELARLTDHHVDQLLVPPGDAPHVVASDVSRLIVDVERFSDDDREPMARVGMGVIYTRTSDGRPLRAAPTQQQRAALLEAYYEPHHHRLTAAVHAALAEHGRALILDLHSFPDAPLPCDTDQDPDRPDICIGTDPFHTPATLRDRFVDAFTAAGYSVRVDRPYAGTMVPLDFLGRDGRVASVMIEVNRRLYVQADGLPKQSMRAVGDALRACIRRVIVEWGSR